MDFADFTVLATRAFRTTGDLAPALFFEAVLRAGAVAFLVATFLAGAFFAAVFFVTVLLAGVAFSAFAFRGVAGASTFSIKNFVRSLAFAIHAGARPRPLQVAPVFGSWYIAGWGPRT